MLVGERSREALREELDDVLLLLLLLGGEVLLLAVVQLVDEELLLRCRPGRALIVRQARKQTSRKSVSEHLRLSTILLA